jgi:methanogenic corrinoid protein MtbC1
MRVVTRRTGLSAELLRVWERRYGVVSPSRTQTGRRLYSDAEIARLHLLYRATQGGRTIGLIANLSDTALADLIRQDAGERPVPATASTLPPDDSGTGAAFVSEALDAITRFDPPALDGTLRRAAIALSATAFLESVVAPLLAQVGGRARDGSFHSVHGRLAVSVVRRVLERTIDIASAPGASARFVVATVRGQENELGAILGAAAAASEGWSVTYLGARLPAEDIAEAAKLLRVRAVGLGLSHPAGDLAVRDELRRLREHLPRSVMLVTGAEAGRDDGIVPDELGAFRLADFKVWIAQLRAAAVRKPAPKRGRRKS